MGIHEYQWNPWESMKAIKMREIHGNPWESMEIDGVL